MPRCRVSCPRRFSHQSARSWAASQSQLCSSPSLVRTSESHTWPDHRSMVDPSTGRTGVPRLRPLLDERLQRQRSRVRVRVAELELASCPRKQHVMGMNRKVMLRRQIETVTRRKLFRICKTDEDHELSSQPARLKASGQHGSRLENSRII